MRDASQDDPAHAEGTQPPGFVIEPIVMPFGSTFAACTRSCGSGQKSMYTSQQATTPPCSATTAPRACRPARSTTEPVGLWGLVRKR